jgi:hypothetical protein
MDDCPVALPQECFIALLKDSYGDGWNGNVLTIEVEDTGEVVHQLTQSGSITAHEEEPFDVCFVCGTCFSVQAGGGQYPTEISWRVTIAGGLPVALGEAYDDATFCTDSCSTTICGAGSQPNAGDDGCEDCEAGRYSGTTSTDFCGDCAPGSYSMSGASSCSTCEAGKSSAAQAATCTNCPSGTYSMQAAPACTGCVAGRYSVEMGSASADNCLLCEDGKASVTLAATSAASCSECQSGKLSAEDRSVCGCDLGSGNNQIGAGNTVVCETCVAGKFSNKAGSTEPCTPCTAGTFTSVGGSVSCRLVSFERVHESAHKTLVLTHTSRCSAKTAR